MSLILELEIWRIFQAVKSLTESCNTFIIWSYGDVQQIAGDKKIWFTQIER